MGQPFLILLLLLPANSQFLRPTARPASSLPPGLSLERIQQILRTVSPDTCGCARQGQNCEMPLPEAERYLGYACPAKGHFCCRKKGDASLPSRKQLEQTITKWVPQHLRSRISYKLLSQMLSPPLPPSAESRQGSSAPAPRGPQQGFRRPGVRPRAPPQTVAGQPRDSHQSLAIQPRAPPPTLAGQPRDRPQPLAGNPRPPPQSLAGKPRAPPQSLAGRPRAPLVGQPKAPLVGRPRAPLAGRPRTPPLLNGSPPRAPGLLPRRPAPRRPQPHQPQRICDHPLPLNPRTPQRQQQTIAGPPRVRPQPAGRRPLPQTSTTTIFTTTTTSTTTTIETTTTTTIATPAPPTFPPFIAAAAPFTPSRQALPVTPQRTKNIEKKHEKEKVVLEGVQEVVPRMKDPFTIWSSGAVYVPGQEREFTPGSTLDPASLGLPSGAKIKLASQVLAKRLLEVPEVTTHHPRQCECRDTSSCPASYRDYITFRKSCPFGLVQCCMEVETLSTPLVPVSLDQTTAKTMDRQTMPELSQIRPVSIPVNLLPEEEQNKLEEQEEPQAARRSLDKGGFVDQTFRKFSQREEKQGPDSSREPTTLTMEATLTPGTTTATPAPRPPAPVTPYTIVSSSMTVSKVVWEERRPLNRKWQVVGEVVPRKKEPFTVWHKPVERRDQAKGFLGGLWKSTVASLWG